MCIVRTYVSRAGPASNFRFARQPPMVPFNRNLIGGLPTN
jgi:hypothetical protein